MDLEKAFQDKTLSLLKKGEKFGVAVSGGVDSMTLLHLVARFTQGLGWKPTVLHLNHQLRGREARKAVRLVKQAAKRYQLPFEASSCSVKSLSREKKVSLEEAGREARFEFFQKIARKHRFKKILLAHHSDDLVETVLMRLFRGSGINGLMAVEEVKKVKGLELIRPLLSVGKEQLRSYAVHNSVSYQEDKTNQDVEFLRNRIRQRVVPFLTKEMGSGSMKKLLDFRSNLHLSQKFIKKEAEKHFVRNWKKKKSSYQISRARFRSLDEAMQYETLSLAYQSLVAKTLERKEWTRVSEVLKGNSKVLNLRANSFFSAKNGHFILSKTH